MDRYLSQAAQQRALADSTLIERACAGDQTAFEILVSRYESDLYRFVCNHLDSEEGRDVVQFVWLQFYRCMSTLQRNPPAGWNDLSLKPWRCQCLVYRSQYRGGFRQCHRSKGTLCPRVSLRLLGDCRALIGPSTAPESRIGNGSFGS